MGGQEFLFAFSLVVGYRQISIKTYYETLLRISSLENTLFHLNRHANNGDDVSCFVKETKAMLQLQLLKKVKEQRFVPRSNGLRHYA